MADRSCPLVSGGHAVSIRSEFAVRGQVTGEDQGNAAKGQHLSLGSELADGWLCVCVRVCVCVCVYVRARARLFLSFLMLGRGRRVYYRSSARARVSIMAGASWISVWFAWGSSCYDLTVAKKRGPHDAGN